MERDHDQKLPFLDDKAAKFITDPPIVGFSTRNSVTTVGYPPHTHQLADDNCDNTNFVSGKMRKRIKKVGVDCDEISSKSSPSASSICFTKEKAKAEEQERANNINRSLESLRNLLPDYFRMNESEENLLDNTIEYIKQLQARAHQDMLMMQNLNNVNAYFPCMTNNMPLMLPCQYQPNMVVSPLDIMISAMQPRNANMGYYNPNISEGNDKDGNEDEEVRGEK